MLPAMTDKFLTIARRLLALFCSPLRRAGARVHAFEQPEGESGLTPKPLVTAKKHMVVAAHPLAAEAGLAMLRKGGSAIDAGIATQMVLNLVEPQSSGLGGGAFMLYWDARRENARPSYDGRETAPAAATPELFLDEHGKPLSREVAIPSGLSIGVPGVLAALKLMHDKYGKLPWAELFQPAIALARDGFPVSPRLAKVLADMGPASFTPEARAYFFDAQGRPWPVGYKLKNPALADTLGDHCPRRHEAVLSRRHRRRHCQGGADDPRKPGTLTAAGSCQLPRQGARAGLRALSRLPRLRRRPALVRRRRGRRGARPDRAVRSRRHAVRAAPQPTPSPRPSGSPSPTAPAIWPIPISSRFRSAGCSTRAISPSAAR